tara:strand:+ start:1052 stop:1492 length:441 start_codon:yes stop_codon:yes gene_type:complete
MRPFSRNTLQAVTALTAATLLSAAPAMADEMWDSALGPILWDSDLGDVAIWRLDDLTNGTVVRLYLPGLAADVSGGRGAYRGFWLAEGGDPAEACLTQMIAPDGMKSLFWGQVTLTFVRPDFPSDWAGVVGQCFDTPSMPLAGAAR